MVPARQTSRIGIRSCGDYWTSTNEDCGPFCVMSAFPKARIVVILTSLLVRSVVVLVGVSKFDRSKVMTSSAGSYISVIGALLTSLGSMHAGAQESSLRILREGTKITIRQDATNEDLE